MNKTRENLLKAIAGESMARNKYTYFAEIAMKEGLVWVARVFEETADNERVHAKEELEKINEKVEMTNTYDIHPLATTLENLKIAAEGEKYEFEVMYPEFAKIAHEENEEEIATLFEKIQTVEEKHNERYNILANLLESGKMFKREEEVEWKCLNCGYIHKGAEAPEECPLCTKPQGWYMPLKIVR
ncbi:rubrerythrin family protein [bacterium]|jgi:rubrerythrin|nr:rubrerythrin family protein [bacterium]